MRKRLLSLALALVMALSLLPVSAFAVGSDFVIVDGVLEKYTGPGGDIVIPDGVYWIKNGFIPIGIDVTSVVIPEGVVAIGGSECSRLSVDDMRSTESATGIPGFYFWDYSMMSEGAFRARSLTSVTFPSTLQYIGNNSFDGCSNLTSVTFPSTSTIQHIGERAFQDCSNLKTVTFPAELCSTTLMIGSSAFSHCKNLETISLPKTKEYKHLNILGYYEYSKIEVGCHAFDWCSALKTVTFAPGGTYRINPWAFEYCTELTTLENAQGITELSDDAFLSCPKITNMTLSADIPPSALAQFNDTPWFKDRYEGGEFVVQEGALIKYSGPGGDVIIPGDLGITAIGKAGFEEATSVMIPEGVTKIEADAFKYCEKLEKVTLPDSLRYIGTSAFQGCDSLNNVVLPKDVVVGSRAFEYCRALANVTLPDSVVCDRCFVDSDRQGSPQLVTPFHTTPFSDTLWELQKDNEFMMVGATLVQYQGSGGDVILPANTRCVGVFVFDDQKAITSITYPKEMKQWANDRIEKAVGEAGIVKKGCWFGFSGCSRLVEFVNAPIVIGEEYEWNRAFAFLEWYRQPVDPGKCLGMPSDRIAAQSNAIVAEAGAVTSYDKAKAIAEWVAKNVKYDMDIVLDIKTAWEAVIDPEQILNGAPTICDGYTRLTNQLLWAQGIPANRIVGKGNNEDHAWTEAWIAEESRWIIIDTTWMAPFVNGTKKQDYEPKYFDMGPVEFSRNHEIESRPYAKKPITLTAYASTQSVLVDGKAVTFQCYALKDANGNDTNYIKLRDVASVLNGTAVQFNVGWDGAVNIETGKGYTTNGSEMKTPFSGNRGYEIATAETRINGSRAALDAIVLKDDAGGAYTYYKLRDLGAALGFRVDWSAEKGIFIETK